MGPETGRILRHLSAAATAVLALALAWSPVPFASVDPVAWSALALAVCVALLLAAPGTKRRHLGPVSVPVAALLGLALWGVLQAMPLPAGWLAALSPERARLWTAAADALGAATGGAEGMRLTLSLTPERTVGTALTFCFLAAAMVTAALVGRDRHRRRWLVAAFGAALAFELIYGARHLLARATAIWGTEVPTAADRLRGTFISPNHFAGYLELGLAVAFAWIWCAVRRSRFESSWETRLLTWLPPVLAWLVLFVALAFTRSRTGLIAALVGVAVQGILLAASTRRWKLAPVGILAATAGVVTVAAIGLQQGFGRLLGPGSTSGVALGARLELYRATLGAWRDFAVVGTGLGSFGDVFVLVQPRELVGTYLHAHSDPLELLLTAGVVGALLVAWGVWRLVVRLYRVLTGARRSEDRSAALAALGALAAMAVHESFDFVLTTPANAFTLAVLCGAAAVAGTRGRPHWRRLRAQPAPAVS